MEHRLRFKAWWVVLVGALAVRATTSPASTVVLESAVLGPTPYPGGGDLSETQLVGWRFHLEESLLVTDVGGHLLGLSGQLFAALVKLESLEAFPAGSPFTETEVLAHKLFTPPKPSDDTLTPLVASLAPGDYALVYGAGQFNATGTGAIANFAAQTLLAPTTADSFISWGMIRPGVFGWRSSLISNMRLVVRGEQLIGTADFNLDGSVDQDDADVWRENYPLASGATIYTGDADGDGDNDGADYLEWQRQYRLFQPASLQAVPEPDNLVAAAVVVLLLMGGRITCDSATCFVFPAATC